MPFFTSRSAASARFSPCSDGKKVFGVFWDGRNVGLYAYDVDGKLAWQKDLGPFKSQHGPGFSPMLYRDGKTSLVIVNNDQDGSAKLLAFDTEKGDLKWEKKREAFRSCYSTPILHETLHTIREILGSELDGITVERAVVGLFFTGVELSNGIAGACATPIKTIPEAVCCPSSAMAMPSPGKLRGRPAFDLAREALGDNVIRRAVGIAAMNALADTCWRRRPHPETELRLGIDAFDATEIRPSNTVVVVGAFVPFLRELKRRRQPFLVL